MGNYFIYSSLLLLLLHTLAVAPANVIRCFNPQDSTSQLANAIFVSVIDFPTSTSGKDDGMDFMMPLGWVMVSG